MSHSRRNYRTDSAYSTNSIEPKPRSTQPIKITLSDATRHLLLDAIADPKYSSKGSGFVFGAQEDRDLGLKGSVKKLCGEKKDGQLVEPSGFNNENDARLGIRSILGTLHYVQKDLQGQDKEYREPDILSTGLQGKYLEAISSAIQDIEWQCSAAGLSLKHPMRRG